MQQLLIDGHNLIAQVPGLALDDPDDEQKLIVMLRKYAARRGAKIVVVFDTGIPGGRSNALSGGGVTAIFAAATHTIADRVLIERINDFPRPADWTVISSDNQVRAVAFKRKAMLKSAQEFVAIMTAPPKGDDRSVVEEKLSSEEVAEWLKVFKNK
ncbi:MAG TPA: NYN domain-containing protein [Anaerolineae bacterium]|nr:NYN domain-containing protein [Anaerolineae bacterium]